MMIVGCRINVTTLLLFTLLNIWLLYTPTDGKCRGKWMIHACGGGNGKRSDGRLAHAPSDRKLGIYLGWREPDARYEEDEEETMDENERGLGGGLGGLGGSSIQMEPLNEDVDQLVGGGGGLERKVELRADPGIQLDDDAILRSTDLERTSENSMDLTGDVDQLEEDQDGDQEDVEEEDDDEGQGDNRKHRLLRNFWQRFFTDPRSKLRRVDSLRFLSAPSDVPEDF